MAIVYGELGDYPVCPACGHRYNTSTADMKAVSGPGALIAVHCPGCDNYYYFRSGGRETRQKMRTFGWILLAFLLALVIGGVVYLHPWR